jgi:hypothetical protein
MRSRDPKPVLAAYRDAYMAAMGTEPTIIEGRGGWYTVDLPGGAGVGRRRLHQLEALTEQLHEGEVQGAQPWHHR